jgi:hypothetical protein
MIVYYIDGEKYPTNDWNKIPWKDVSSLDENTPAWESITTKSKLWCRKGRILHRLTGPAYISRNGIEQFYLNGKYYETVHDWLKDHPNPDLYFDAIGMNETDKVLWFLQN